MNFRFYFKFLIAVLFFVIPLAGMDGVRRVGIKWIPKLGWGSRFLFANVGTAIGVGTALKELYAKDELPEMSEEVASWCKEIFSADPEFKAKNIKFKRAPNDTFNWATLGSETLLVGPLVEQLTKQMLRDNNVLGLEQQKFFILHEKHHLKNNDSYKRLIALLAGAVSVHYGSKYAAAFLKSILSIKSPQTLGGVIFANILLLPTAAIKGNITSLLFTGYAKSQEYAADRSAIEESSREELVSIREFFEQHNTHIKQCIENPKLVAPYLSSYHAALFGTVCSHIRDYYEYTQSRAEKKQPFRDWLNENPSIFTIARYYLDPTHPDSHKRAAQIKKAVESKK